MAASPTLAPGKPGKPAQWTAGAKTGVGTALSTDSSVWFTLSHGVLNEIFFPFVDTACVREMELLVTDRANFFSEEKRDTRSEISYLAEGVPAFALTNTCVQGRYRIEKTVLTDPRRPVVLQQIHFVPLQGQLADYAIFVLLQPHLGNQGAANTAWVGHYKGVPMLFAARDSFSLALACSLPWRCRSAGYTGVSDGRQELARHKQLTETYERAEDGNVALTGEVDLATAAGPFVLALGFGRDAGEAGHRARASLLQGFEAARATYVKSWSDWQATLLPLEGTKQHPQHLYRISAAVMRTHEDKAFPGGIIASLAVPWGNERGDDDLGYHLVWPRDLIETVGGLLAARQHEDARRVLFYFQVTQDADGRWPQNMWLNGVRNRDGIQLDETAFVMLLVGLAQREGSLTAADLASLWPMVRLAASYLVRQGPMTPMDRWEEESGYFASTMAVQVPALLVAAELAEAQGEKDTAGYLRETADAWNALIEPLLYVTGTPLAREVGVEGYYVRFALPGQMHEKTPAAGEVTLKNHAAGAGHHRIANVVSPDALTLVRFGLRAASDPRITNTVRVIDHCLRVETPRGPGWHRYTDDGYGEHLDGSPFDGTGVGRIWPLLTGERAHYELAAGRQAEAQQLLDTLESFANESGLLPEQVWDDHDLPERELFFGKPSGSAMPLVWAHAEYVKLRRSLNDGRVFDMPHQAVRRYLENSQSSPHVCWRFGQAPQILPAGKVLRVEVLAPARLHWSTDGWQTAQDISTRDTGLGIHLADLPTEVLSAGTDLVFTFYWPKADRWEGNNFQVAVVEPPSQHPPAPVPAATDSGRHGKRRSHAQTQGKKG